MALFLKDWLSLRYKATGNRNGKLKAEGELKLYRKGDWREVEITKCQLTTQSKADKRRILSAVGVTKVFQIPFSVFQKLKCKWPWTSEITMICTKFLLSVPITLCDGVKEETVLKPESEDTYLSHRRLRKRIFWAMGQWMKGRNVCMSKQMQLPSCVCNAMSKRADV